VRDAREEVGLVQAAMLAATPSRAFLMHGEAAGPTGAAAMSDASSSNAPDDLVSVLNQDHGPFRMYYRPSEVAKLTGLARSTVFNALYSGELSGFQKGRAWLIPADAIKRWIQGDENAA
jgi:excisionase family DNA binding protein